MKNISKKIYNFIRDEFIFSFIILSILFFFTKVNAQIPTVNIPTVTGTDRGIVITVKDDSANPQINVRSGPGTEYDKVGTLLANQQVIGKGRTDGGNWLLIDYAGGPNGYAWVYSSYVTYVGDLPIVDIPATPTPRITNTIDPTLAAQFIITIEPTRLATFTAPPPLSIPTFQTAQGVNVKSSIPMGLIIIGTGLLGLIIGLFTLSQKR